jgi:hypothetical protein
MTMSDQLLFARNINICSSYANAAVIVFPGWLIIFNPGLMGHLGFLAIFVAVDGLPTLPPFLMYWLVAPSVRAASPSAPPGSGAEL